MASVYPTIIVQDEQKTLPRLQRFYFQSKSGKVTETLAADNRQADVQYRETLLPYPFLQYPNTFVWCCIPSWNASCGCGGRRCPTNSHWPSLTGGMFYEEWDRYIDFFHTILEKYPDFFSSGRFMAMYGETPMETVSEWRTTVTRADGSVWNYNPGKYMYTWKKANVQFQTDRQQTYPFYRFLRSIGKVDNDKICCETVRHNLSTFTSDHWDRLAGSLKPLTERPTLVEVQMEEVRKPTTVRRRKGDYELISLHETS